jgi:hypothetical protein
VDRLSGRAGRETRKLEMAASTERTVQSVNAFTARHSPTNYSVAGSTTRSNSHSHTAKRRTCAVLHRIGRNDLDEHGDNGGRLGAGRDAVPRVCEMGRRDRERVLRRIAHAR